MTNLTFLSQIVLHLFVGLLCLVSLLRSMWCQIMMKKARERISFVLHAKINSNYNHIQKLEIENDVKQSNRRRLQRVIKRRWRWRSGTLSEWREYRWLRERCKNEVKRNGNKSEHGMREMKKKIVRFPALIIIFHIRRMSALLCVDWITFVDSLYFARTSKFYYWINNPTRSQKSPHRFCSTFFSYIWKRNVVVIENKIEIRVTFWTFAWFIHRYVNFRIITSWKEMKKTFTWFEFSWNHQRSQQRLYDDVSKILSSHTHTLFPY